jgi:hypothetical protein
MKDVALGAGVKEQVARMIRRIVGAMVMARKDDV